MHGQVRFVLDPGHGGFERAGRSTPIGVESPCGFAEKNLTLDLARRLRARLGAGAILTRDADVNATLAARARTASRAQAPVFVSLHASDGRTGASRQTFVHTRASRRSIELAHAIDRELERIEPSLGVLHEDLAVLTPEAHHSETAACLIEVGSLGDRRGEVRFGDPSTLDLIASAIAAGVHKVYGRSSEDLHRQMADEYARQHHLPPGSVDPSIVYSDEYEEWLTTIPAPATKPVLPIVPKPSLTGTCPKRSFDCVKHSDFLEMLPQIVSNIANTPTPYAPGIARVLKSVVDLAVAGGVNSFPDPKAQTHLNFMAGPQTVRISSTTSVEIDEFTLDLMQTGDPFNGQYLGTGGRKPHFLILNETSRDAVFGIIDQVGRTVYHEMIHFFVGLVTALNRQGRGQNPELDESTYELLRADYIAAISPFLADAFGVAQSDPSVASSAELGFDRMRAEAIPRVEEAVFLAMQQGLEYKRGDVATTREFLLQDAAYWPWSGPDMERVIKARRAEIIANVIPIVKQVQQRFLAFRPAS